MSFVTRDVALRAVCGLRDAGATGRRNRALGDQARRAASSILLNIEEGNQRRGGDRQHLFRIAKGSVEELRAALILGVSWGYIEEPAEAFGLLDRLGRLLYGLVKPQSKASSRLRRASTDAADDSST